MLTRYYPDEQAIPVRVVVGDYTVQQWHNPASGMTLVMATFPVVNGRIEDGHMPIFNTATGRPEVVPVHLTGRSGQRAVKDANEPEDFFDPEIGPADVDLWERPLWLVYLAWMGALLAAIAALALLVIWLRLRS